MWEEYNSIVWQSFTLGQFLYQLPVAAFAVTLLASTSRVEEYVEYENRHGGNFKLGWRKFQLGMDKVSIGDVFLRSLPPPLLCSINFNPHKMIFPYLPLQSVSHE